MTFVAAAIGGALGYGVAGTLTGAAIGAGIGGMIGGGVNQASTAKEAAAMQAAATGNAAELQYLTSQDAIAFQKEMFEKQLELGQPYREAGYGGLTRLNQMLPNLTSPVTAADIQNMPGYQFAVKQGTGGAMQGMNVGGGGSNVQRAGQKFAIDYTMGTALPQLMQQKRDIYNTLSGVANIGQMQPGAGAAAGTLGTNVANTMMGSASNIGQLGVAGANALASGQIGAANAYGNTIGQLGNAGMMYALLG
jgi:hypothetical protein